MACACVCLVTFIQLSVFLTYTYDNKRHMKNVLHVCDCLKKNNFSVGLDARESHLLREDGERTRWHDMRYDKVASFVLYLVVVILYLLMLISSSCVGHCSINYM